MMETATTACTEVVRKPNLLHLQRCFTPMTSQRPRASTSRKRSELPITRSSIGCHEFLARGMTRFLTWAGTWARRTTDFPATSNIPPDWNGECRKFLRWSKLDDNARYRMLQISDLHLPTTTNMRKAE